MTAEWRRRHVLAPARLDLDGPVLDLTDVDQRGEIELRHAELLTEHGMSHLDLHEVTTGRRIVTQTIAAAAFDELEATAIRFASRLDGLPCYALFEGHGRLSGDGEPVQLTDPAPEALQNMAASWRMAIEPTATIAARPRS